MGLKKSLNASRLTVTLIALLCSQVALADENGISYWIPGLFGSLAAVPQQPGWSVGMIYYHPDVSAGGAVAASREITIGKLSPAINVNLDVNLKARADMAIFSPSYVFATPVLGGQFAVGMAVPFGRMDVGLNGTLTTNIGLPHAGSITDALTGFGDLFPQASLRWHSGVHNVMTYVTGDIPVGAYDPMRLANIGIGHGAVDSGAGYTYLDLAKGQEFSATAGFTYNLKNPDTQYQSGVDFHLDLGISQFLSKQVFVGAVGYFYDQITADRGAPPRLGDFKSRVAGVGPQIGFLFPVGDMHGYLNLKGYREFDAAARPSGWNVWLTFAVSPAASGGH
jgi:hypothetical protein